MREKKKKPREIKENTCFKSSILTFRTSSVSPSFLQILLSLYVGLSINPFCSLLSQNGDTFPFLIVPVLLSGVDSYLGARLCINPGALCTTSSQFTLFIASQIVRKSTRKHHQQQQQNMFTRTHTSFADFQGKSAQRGRRLVLADFR